METLARIALNFPFSTISTRFDSFGSVVKKNENTVIGRETTSSSGPVESFSSFFSLSSHSSFFSAGEAGSSAGGATGLWEASGATGLWETSGARTRPPPSRARFFRRRGSLSGAPSLSSLREGGVAEGDAACPRAFLGRCGAQLPALDSCAVSSLCFKQVGSQFYALVCYSQNAP